jgi:hypothetical protein
METFLRGDKIKKGSIGYDALSDDAKVLIGTNGDSSFEKGDAENSAVLKGGNNQVISESGVALGADNLVGLKGFYYKHIRFVSSKLANIYLSKIQVLPTITTGGEIKDKTIIPSDYLSVDDTISIVNDNKYNDIAVISNMSEGMIQIKWLSKAPFSSIKTELNISPEDYSIYCLDKPTQGISDLGKYSFATGTNNKAINTYTEVSGKGNIAKGKFAKVWGKDNVGGYNTTTFGTNNVNLADNSFVNGTNNINEGSNSVIHGNKNKNYGKRAFVVGNENVTNNENEVAFGQYNNSEDDTQFSIGIGTSSERKNAFEVKQNGDIYIKGVEGRIQDKLNDTSKEKVFIMPEDFFEEMYDEPDENGFVGKIKQEYVTDILENRYTKMLEIIDGNPQVGEFDYFNDYILKVKIRRIEDFSQELIAEQIQIVEINVNRDSVDFCKVKGQVFTSYFPFAYSMSDEEPQNSDGLKRLMFIDSFLTDSGTSLPEENKQLFKKNMGSFADWNVQEGEAGYIENKPFGVYLEKETLDFLKNRQYEEIESPFEEYPYCYKISGERMFGDLYGYLYGIWDYDKKEYDLKKTYFDGYDQNTYHLMKGDVWYDWGGDIWGKLKFDNDPYGGVDNCDIYICVADNGLTNYNDTIDYLIQEVYWLRTSPNVYKINQEYLPDTVLKTTPQELSDDDKNQALANLGIDPVVWKYMCNPYIISAYTPNNDLPEELRNIIEDEDGYLTTLALKVLAMTNYDGDTYSINYVTSTTIKSELGLLIYEQGRFYPET